MTNKIDYSRARQRILELFVPGCDSAAVARSIGAEDMIVILDAVSSSLPSFSNQHHLDALSMFLYEGAKLFDRWFPPSPFVVPLDHDKRFAKFVNAFWSVEKANPTNCAVFKLHYIKDMVFKKFDESPLNSITEQEIAKFKTKVERIAEPSISPQLEEFLDQKSELIFILKGLEDRSLQTIFQFRIPYVIHKQPIKVDFTWSGISMRAFLVPCFGKMEESLVHSVGDAAISVGASRWQTGSSKITIEQDRLVDGSAYTDCLQALPGVDLPINGWPKSFTLAFSIFHDLVWQIRAKHNGHQDWIPAPRDLSDLEFFMKTSSIDNIGWIRKGSPAQQLHIFVPSENFLNISLGDLTRLPWPTECRIKANMYLELGDTNEALFWLNVAVEALITQRFHEIEEAIARPGLAAELGSPKEFWSEAESIISKQFPEMACKVEWPKSQIHVSVFGKLKVLYRLVPMKTSYDELIRKYKDVSNERNDLFHGKQTSRVTVGIVQIASNSLIWIDENMWPRAVSENDFSG